MSPEPTAAPIVIRPATAVDWPPVWRLLEPAIRAGEVFYFPRDMTGEAARRAWFEGMEAVFVAVDPATLAVIGCYYLRTNAPGAGSHMSNAGYIVDAAQRGRGIAAALCRHSLAEAGARGYRAMQFNYVVSTNAPAVHVWKSAGFAVVGTLPGAFAHPTLGYVDVYVMYRTLEPR
jgi:L-amino acid N-acyltransferase YncA